MDKLTELKILEQKWNKGEITHIIPYDINSKMKIKVFVFDGKFSGVETEYGFIGMWHIKGGK